MRSGRRASGVSGSTYRWLARAILTLALALVGAAGACPQESSIQRVDELRAAADNAIAAGDHCAAADALLRLASSYELRLEWDPAYDAARRGIDVWSRATLLDFLLEERDRARVTGLQDTADEYDRKVRELGDHATLLIAPKSDPPCHLTPPSISLVSASLLAARVALRASKLPEASRALEEARREMWPDWVPWNVDPDDEREFDRLSLRYREAVRALSKGEE